MPANASGAGGILGGCALRTSKIPAREDGRVFTGIPSSCAEHAPGGSTATPPRMRHRMSISYEQIRLLQRLDKLSNRLCLLVTHS
jgi:hypothetical protein